MSPAPTVLVIDDELHSLEALRRVLAEEFDVIGVRDAAGAEAVLSGEMVQVILCDQRLPGASGVDFLRRVREVWPDPVRMILSAPPDSADIVAGVNEAGIHQFITKPWHPEHLVQAVREATDLFHLQTATVGVPNPARLREAMAGSRPRDPSLHEFGRIVHAPGSPMAAAIGLGRRAADYDISVLITGASGTGKELLARAIHHASTRAGRAFVVENCAALSDELLESELFGCKKGAFTGAWQDRIGLFEVADGGSIFLDEIGETSASFQVKLLRVLQEGEIRPLGAQRPRRVDVRVISATNRDLAADVQAGRFRRDLYYRLAAFPIHLPPLRERPADIPAIAARILHDVNRAFRRAVPSFDADTLRRLAEYGWPGNVRELHNEIQRMVALSDADRPLPPALLSPSIAAANHNGNGAAAGVALKDRVEALERGVIDEALDRHAGNISRAAAELGLSRVGLRNKIARYDIRTITKKS